MPSSPQFDVPPRRMADAVRILSVDAIEKAKSGHPGMPLGMADAAVALFGTGMKFDPNDPLWPDRDRFVLSAGHGSMLLYAALHLTGYPGFGIDTLKNFRQWKSIAAGHPEVEQAHGIETTTGPLGQGLATAVGMALAERVLAAKFGADLVNHHTYVVCGDGCLMEGISHEAASMAGHLRLSKLIVLYDDNDVSIDGPTSLSYSEDASKRFDSYGWLVELVDGHDVGAVAAALANARQADRPTMIRCKTVIGFGTPNMAGDPASHSGALGADEVAGTRAKLGWEHPPFYIPAEIKSAWEAFASLGQQAHRDWQARLAVARPERRQAFLDTLDCKITEDLPKLIAEYKRWTQSTNKVEATRFASGDVLERLVPVIPALLGGSADLTPANNTQTKGRTGIDASSFGGGYVHYGAREHGMAAAMNGMALHKGLIPYAGTFLVFTDYSRPAIRLGALMGQQVIHVMTHDSICLGEDGPTHQPVEHLASLRAMPGLLTFRPADAVEVGECWELALGYRDGPSVIALSRHPVALVRREVDDENRSAKGGYILANSSGEPDVSIIATGAEVGLAIQAREQLEAEGIKTRVISMPCVELFEMQHADWQNQTLGEAPIRIAVEAGMRMGWDRYIGRDGSFIGMSGFGASAPADVLFEKFGITTAAIVAEAQNRLKLLGVA
ncbi:MAG: transketolase [Paracoccaceae bacterium]|nr:transketolase [Paracoccaceae bacterium]